jgi:predicted nucleic acid-binding Zn ribbon protein
MDRGLERYFAGDKPLQRLGDALKAYMKRTGLASQLKHRGIYEVWRKALRSHADHTRVLGVRRGVLQVEVDSAPLLQELEFQRHILLKTLQAEVQEPFVSEIHFRVGSFDSSEEE